MNRPTFSDLSDLSAIADCARLTPVQHTVHALMRAAGAEVAVAVGLMQRFVVWGVGACCGEA